MKLSQTSEMAIHGLWELALCAEEDRRLLVSEIARRHNVSESYLAKIFHRLGQAGIVLSRRGKVGGFRLARPADAITVGEIVRLFEVDLCNTATKLPKKVGNNPREQTLYTVMQDVEERVFEVLDGITLADLRTQTPDSDSPKLCRRKYTRRVGKA